MAASPLSTPKRKHSELLHDHIPNLNTTTQFTFDSRSPVKDGSASPRTRVAHRFRGLALEGGGGGDGSGGCRISPSPEPKSIRHAFSLMQNEAHSGARKRVKLPGVELADVDISDPRPSPTTWDDAMQAVPRPGPQPTAASPKHLVSRSPSQKSPRSVRFALETAVVEQSENTKTHPVVTQPPSSDNTETLLDGSKPRSRARAGTPPLTYKASSTDAVSSLDDSFIIDPLRASLTWHDDEITIYDPDDSDDDGTGINGIGFKPTPAVAYARAVKRGRQLAEYRKREEREARAKRSQRRRGSPVPGLVELKGTVERRRVRFMESATELISF